MIFGHNRAGNGCGALCLKNSKIIINTNATLTFNNNSAFKGGAIYLEKSAIHVCIDAIHFHNNCGSSIEFITNTARSQGGAIYIESGVNSSIIVDNFSNLHLFNNSAFQGGALYIIDTLSPSFVFKIGYKSRVEFLKNTAFDIGGGLYVKMQSTATCVFIITSYTAFISFSGNHANRNIGHHMYGASVRTDKCDKSHISFTSKPYCSHQHEHAHKHINISFDPGLKDTPSPVSSAPQRVCLCDSSGRPQCANLSLVSVFIEVKLFHYLLA